MKDPLLRIPYGKPLIKSPSLRISFQGSLNKGLLQVAVATQAAAVAAVAAVAAAAAAATAVRQGVLAGGGGGSGDPPGSACRWLWRWRRWSAREGLQDPLLKICFSESLF